VTDLQQEHVQQPRADRLTGPELARVLFRPRSIAVVGASDNPVKLGGRPVDYLKRFGFTGRVLPVNPHRDTVQGLPAFPSLDAIDGEIDLAMLMVDARGAAEAVRAAGRRGIRAAIVGAAGFAETGGDGVRLQAELLAAARESGVRVLGPNCLGLIGVADGVVPTFTSALDEDGGLRTGPVAFASQSGAFGTFIFSAAQHAGIGFSQFVNSGNELDLTTAELLDLLVGLDETEVLLAYLEGVSDGGTLLAAARRAHAADKPIVAVKVGRSDAGARAAASHTASLAGEDAVFDSVARQFGIVRVPGTEPMLDAAQIFATGRRARGRRLTTLSLSGGAGALMADEAESSGLTVGTWDPEWQERMAAVIPAYGSPRNPVDLTASLISDTAMLNRSLEVAVEHPGTDMIAVLLGNASRNGHELVAAIEKAYRSTDIPIAVVWTGGDGRAPARLQELGIPCYPDPGRAAAALARLADFSLRPALPAPVRPDDCDPAAARALVDAVRSAGRTRLDEEESARLVRAYRLPIAPSVPCGTADEAVAAAAGLGGPVAVKVLSAAIGHKSDLGGVRLGLTDPGEIRAAAAELLRLAGEYGEPRVLVQQMAAPTAAGGRRTELILGAKRDPAFGPVVVVGLGGVLVEVLADSRAAVAPLDHEGAVRLLRSLRAAAVLDGVRGGSALDVDAAADAVVRLSWLANDLGADLAELDVNPLLLGAAGEGAIAVDSLAALTAQNPTDEGEHA
jgi:acyl-CoA synthetase (NDP forming)